MKSETLRKRFLPATLFLIITLVVALSGILVPSTASALSIVDFTVSNEDLGVDGPYGQVTWDVSGDTATFAVNAYEDILTSDGIGDNFGIDKFFFNTTLDTETFGYDLPDGWGISINKNADGFGEFMIEVTDPPRKDPLQFSITGLGLGATDSDFYVLSTNTAGHGNGHFAMHVGGFGTPLLGQTSAYFRDTPSIPDPAAVFLLGSACLIGFSGARRKFKK